MDRCTLGTKHMKSTHSVGPFAPPFAHSSHQTLRSRAPLRSVALIRLLAHSLTHTRAHGKEIYVHELNALISYRIKPMCDEAMGGRTEPPVEIQGHIKKISFP